jgi:hypothetical protein
MRVAAEDDVGLGENRTFQDPIVRFISQYVEMRLSLEDGGCLADALQDPEGVKGPFVVCR